MKVKNNLTFNGSIASFEDHNSSFFRVKIKLIAFGYNANGSAFNQITSRAKNSLKMIPIVAKYNSDYDAYGNIGDLEGHNAVLRKDKNDEYEMHMDTYPFGTTSSDTTFSLEEVNEGTEIDPNIKTYVVIDNVYLWKRYDATKKITEWISQGIVPKISVEIDNVNGQFDSNGYFQIEDFEFQAIAALGSEVQPCFPRAEIELYSKQSFKDEFKALVYELNETLQLEQEGGTKMENATQETTEQEVVETVEETTEVTETVEQEFEQVEEASSDEVVAELEKDEQPIVEEFNEASASTEDITEEVETVIETESDEAEIEEVEVVDYESKFNKLSAEFTKLQSQLDELATYKRQREESDIKAKFADKLSEEEFAQVFESMKDAEIQDVEDKLFALYGKKNFSISSSNTSTQVNKVKLALPKEEDVTQSPYGGLFEKFNNKQEN